MIPRYLHRRRSCGIHLRQARPRRGDRRATLVEGVLGIPRRARLPRYRDARGPGGGRSGFRGVAVAVAAGGRGRRGEPSVAAVLEKAGEDLLKGDNELRGGRRRAVGGRQRAAGKPARCCEEAGDVLLEGDNELPEAGHRLLFAVKRVLTSTSLLCFDR